MLCDSSELHNLLDFVKKTTAEPKHSKHHQTHGFKPKDAIQYSNAQNIPIWSQPNHNDFCQKTIESRFRICPNTVMQINIKPTAILQTFENNPFATAFENLNLTEKLIASQILAPSAEGNVFHSLKSGQNPSANLHDESDRVIVGLRNVFESDFFLEQAYFDHITPKPKSTAAGQTTYSNQIDPETKDFESLQDFAYRISSDYKLSEQHIRINDQGRLEATSRPIDAEHIENHNLRLIHITHGIFSVAAWDAKLGHWTPLDKNAIFDSTHPKFESNQQLLDAIFSIDRNNEESVRAAYFQTHSLHSMLDFFDCFVSTQKMKANANRQLQMNRIPAFAALSLITDGVDRNFIQDGSAEMDLASAAAEIYKSLFENFWNSNLAKKLSGFAETHMERFLKSYTVHYIQTVIDTNLFLDRLDTNTNIEDVYRLTAQHLRYKSTKPFENQDILNKLVELSLSIRNQAQLDPDTKREFINISQIYVDVFDADDRQNQLRNK